MFPQAVETPRSRQLMSILDTADVSMKSWEMPKKDDFALVGAFIVLYSYIDFI